MRSFTTCSIGLRPRWRLSATRLKPTDGFSSPDRYRRIPDNEDEPLPVGIEAQTRRVMDNLKLVLSEIGLGLEHVVSARAFLIDMREFETMNKIYASYFPPNKRPARTCIGVTGLAKAARVEIDFIARRP